MRYGVRAVIRAIVSSTLLVALYYALPLDGLDDRLDLTRLALGSLVLLLVMAWQIRSVIGSPRPALRAIEAVAVSLPLFLLSVATLYVLMSSANGEAFTESLTRTDALYFSITVFSTVGFGDITPLTQAARVAVMVQIALDLLLLGVGVRILVGAVNIGKERRQSSE